eukprot:TRINITY_DN7418_c0_g1_i1.p1 TRINITY_DN7418_c0_g1~~TRINITY_DN7418_c0_g1_i1.p1  ORF type:complete len:309 (+),score=64.52 TRINITY_DN7418_c0_g1_i1:100-1026(+)
MAGAAGDTAWVGKKPLRRLGGMADALSIASDLGFSVPQPQEDSQNLGHGMSAADKKDSLIRVLRELTTAQRNLANLQVELQGRQDDNSVAHLTHVSEMEKKCQKLAKTTAILRDVIQNKDRIIARLQQPYSLDCLPVEAEFQRQFSELLLKAASDYGALTTAIADFQWSQNFKNPPSVWGEMLRPIPIALASCTRYFEAISAIRESMKSLHKARTGSTTPTTPPKASSCVSDHVESDCATPPTWKSTLNLDDAKPGYSLMQNQKKSDQPESPCQEPELKGSISTETDTESLNQRRLSWSHLNVNYSPM